MANKNYQEPTASNPNGSYRVSTEAADQPKKRGWLWLLPLLALLIIGGLLAMHAANNNDTAKTTTSNNTATANQTSASANQAASTLSAKFEQSVVVTDRNFYFNADTAALQDAAQTDSGITKIKAFYMANMDTKFNVNGSVYTGKTGDTADQLAQQRAVVIRDKLVAAGIPSDHLATTSTNTYKGQTDAEQAEYARSVTVSVKQ